MPVANTRPGSTPISVTSLSTIARQESDVVDVEPVRAVVADDVARVPVALVPIRIDDRKTMFVRKALEPISRLYSHLRTVFPEPCITTTSGAPFASPRGT